MAVKDATAYFDSGKKFYDQDEYDKAITELNEAIKLDPNHRNAGKFLAFSYYARGMLYYQNNEFSRAVQDFTKALEYDKDDIDFLKARGMSYMNLGEWGKLIDDFSCVIAHDDKDAQVYCIRGSAYGKTEQWENAYADYDKATHLEEKKSLAWSGRGFVSFRMNNFNEAKIALTRAIFLGSDNIQDYYFLGDACRRTQQWKDAHRYLKKVLDKDPLHEGAKASMIVVMSMPNALDILKNL